MLDFHNHLFQPYIINEGFLDGIFGSSTKSSKPPLPTLAQERRRKDELDGLPDGTRVNPFGGPRLTDEILRRQAAEADWKRKMAIQVGGHPEILTNNSPTPQQQSSSIISPRTTPSQPTNPQPVNSNSNFFPNSNGKSFFLTPNVTTRVTSQAAATNQSNNPKFVSTSSRLEELKRKLAAQKRKKGVNEMSIYTPYLFHSPLLEHNEEYLNEIGILDMAKKIWGGKKDTDPGSDSVSDRARRIINTQTIQERLPRDQTHLGEIAKRRRSLAQAGIVGPQADGVLRTMAWQDRLKQKQNNNPPSKTKSSGFHDPLWRGRR